jgi:hypothetical protein
MPARKADDEDDGDIECYHEVMYFVFKRNKSRKIRETHCFCRCTILDNNVIYLNEREHQKADFLTVHDVALEVVASKADVRNHGSVFYHVNPNLFKNTLKHFCCFFSFQSAIRGYS